MSDIITNAPEEQKVRNIEDPSEAQYFVMTATPGFSSGLHNCVPSICMRV